MYAACGDGTDDKSGDTSNAQRGATSSRADVEAKILVALPGYTQYGWTGGAANDGSSGDSQAKFFAITDLQIDGNEVRLSYAWKGGVLKGTLSGTEIAGSWTQSDGSGPMALEFSEQGDFVRGWWADESRPSEQHPAFLLE